MNSPYKGFSYILPWPHRRVNSMFSTKSGPAVSLILALSALIIVGCAPTATENAPFARPKPYEFHNANAGFDFLVWSENKTPLIIGGYLRLKARATIDVYVNLYAVDSNYDTRQLLLNHPLHANITLPLGGPHRLTSYRLKPPPGTETYIVIATRTPLDRLEPNDIRHPERMPELALNAGQLTRRLREVLDTLPSADWNATVLDRRVEWPRNSSSPKIM